MENNENLNNQVNESNNVQEEVNNQIDDNIKTIINNNPPVENNNQMPLNGKSKNNNFLIILFVLIIVGIGGYFAYTKFITKEEPKINNNANETTTPIPGNDEDKNSISDNVVINNNANETTTPTPGNDKDKNSISDNVVDGIVFAGNDLSFVIEDDKIYTYDSNEKLINEKKYDKVVRGSDESRGYIAIVYENNNCYLVDDTGKLIELSLDNNYKSNNKIAIYKQNENYYVVTDDKYYLTDMDLAMYENDDTYGSICLDPDHMICSGTLLVNIKTKEIIDYGEISVYKTSTGYYFVDESHERDSVADEPYSMKSATRIFTDKNVTIKEEGLYTVVGDIIVVETKDGLAEYNINGKKTQTFICDDVYGIGEEYAFVKKDNKNYLVNLKNNFSTKEIQINDSIKVKYVYEVDEKEMIFSTGEGDSYEEFYQKYSFETGKVESALSSDESN